MMQSSGLCIICKKPAVKKCASCHRVFYCCKDHQKEHWPLHRESCQAYEKRNSPTGRYLITTRTIHKGFLLLKDGAIVIGPGRSDAVPGTCLGCYDALPLKSPKCPECEWPACSINCIGLRDPMQHGGSECELVKIVKKVTGECRLELILPLRCLILQTTNSPFWEYLERLGQEANLKNGNYQLDSGWMSVLSDLKRIAPHVSHIVPDCSDDTLKNVYALVKKCGREIFTLSSGPLTGVYPFFVWVGHSCLPNVLMTYDPPTPGEPLSKWLALSRVQASKTILKGEKITFSFVNGSWPTLKRMKELKCLQDTPCTCARCLDATELGSHTGTLKCVKCPGLILPVNPSQIEKCKWVCDKGCGMSLTKAMVEELQDRLLIQIGKVLSCTKIVSRKLTFLRATREPTADQIERLMNLLEKCVHPRHFLCMLAKFLLAKSYGEDEKSLHALTTEKLLKKTALCKEVWTTLSDDIIFVHNPSVVADCRLDQCRADFELLKRYFDSKKWDSNRTARAIADCRSLIKMVVNFRMESFSPAGVESIQDAKKLELDIQTWAKAKGVRLLTETIKMSSSNATCAFCEAPAVLKCSGCSAVYYCNKGAPKTRLA